MPTKTSKPRVGTAEWWREQSTRREPLSVQRIVRAALDVLDREGIDALTMRRVAAELDVAAPSLYRHVENRDALLLHMSEAVMAEVDLSVVGDTWQEQAAELARAARTAMTRHPGLATRFLGSGSLGPNALAAFDAGLQVCLNAGFPEDLAVTACQAVAFLVRSFAVLEATGLNSLAVEPGMLTGDAGAPRFPAASSVSGTARADADELFEFFLAATIAQLERRLAETTKTKRKPRQPRASRR